MLENTEMCLADTLEPWTVNVVLLSVYGAFQSSHILHLFITYILCLTHTIYVAVYL